LADGKTSILEKNGRKSSPSETDSRKQRVG
jgi:hypothetical protein